MDSNNLQLDDASRTKLDGVVQQMTTNNEPDSNIQAVVDDFKQKYGTSTLDPKINQGGGIVSPFFTSNPQEDNNGSYVGNATEAGAKTLGNLVPSAINTAVGVAKTPIEGIAHIGDIPGAIKDAYQASGGLGNFVKNFAEGVYENVIPVSAQQLLKGDTSAAQKTITEDPVGQVLPWLLLGREAAIKISPEAGAAFDNAVTKVGKPVADAGSKIVSNTLGLPAKAGNFMISGHTGLEPSTLDQIKQNPSAFSKEAQASTSALSVANEVKSALDKRIEDLSETGQAYKPIRDNASAVVIDPNFLKDEIQKTTGVTITEPQVKAPTLAKGELPTIQTEPTPIVGGKPGIIESSGSSYIRDPKDIKALQNFYNTWQPYFDKGEMTPNEFLNMRTDLAKLSKFDREISKSGELESTSKTIRANLNNAYRTQMHGLEDTDATWSSQKEELESLQKGLLDKDGNLTDTSISKIANSTKGNKNVLQSQLEEISPGITKKVNILKAIKDIEYARGNKVGVYARAMGGLGQAGLFGGILTGNLPLIAGSLAEMITANPDFAVPMLRAYGWNKNLVGAVLEKLNSGISKINQLPQKGQSMSSLIPKLKSSRIK